MSRKWIRQIIISLVCLFVLQASVIADSSEELPEVFSHRDLLLAPAQTVERVLISDADAVIMGKVMEGIISVDGDITITSTGKVGGQIIVLGGQLTVEGGARIEQTPWVIAPQAFSFTKIVITAFIIAGLTALFAFPYLIWGLLHLLQKLPLYQHAKRLLLAIEERWPAVYIAASLAFSGLMLFMFAKLAWQTIFRNTMSVFDNMVIWLVRYFAVPGLDQAMIIITNLGYGTIYNAIVLGSAGLLALLRRWRELEALLLCLLGGAALNSFLKYVFERERPEAFRLVEAAGYSFPSGHAMVSLCFYGMIAFLLARQIRSWHGRNIIIVCAVFLIAGIGVSRIYLGVHYPSDVVAGYAAGATWLAFSISLLLWREQKQSGRK